MHMSNYAITNQPKPMQHGQHSQQHMIATVLAVLPHSDHAGWGLGPSLGPNPQTGLAWQARFWILQQSKSPIAAIIVTHALLLAPSNLLCASCQPLAKLGWPSSSTAANLADAPRHRIH